MWKEDGGQSLPVAESRQNFQLLDAKFWQDGVGVYTF